MTSLTNDETSMGEVLHDGVRIGLRYVRRFDHPVERVWSAITESEQLRFWMPCDIVGERRAGADIKLPFWPAAVEKYQLEETALSGRIEVWDPPTVFQWSWSGDILRFELAKQRRHDNDLHNLAGVARPRRRSRRSRRLPRVPERSAGPARRVLHLHSRRATKLPDASRVSTRSNSLWARAQARDAESR